MLKRQMLIVLALKLEFCSLNTMGSMVDLDGPEVSGTVRILT